MIKIDSISKYLHIERQADGTLYIYNDNKTWGGKEVTKEQMDTECNMNVGGTFHLYIPLSDFVGVVK